MSTFDRIFGGEPSAPREPRERSPIDRITGRNVLVAVTLILVALLIGVSLMSPSASSPQNAELQLTLQRYCMGEVLFGEMIEARNELIQNYWDGQATRDDLSVAIDNLDCATDSASPLQSQMDR